MASNLSLGCGILILVLISHVHGENDTRSDVVFVIDDTISMGPEIDQLKETMQEIFTAVLESKNSQIGSFILITFNDNEVEESDMDVFVEDLSLQPIKLRTITRDPAEFVRKLEEIYVDGGGLCPELCLSGIKRAVEESNPNSFIYVLTDASARDYNIEDTVKNMAKNKSIQINFIVTGDCEHASSPDLLVYDKLAEATSGQVFHVGKYDIKKMTKYIVKSIDAPKTPLVHKPINMGINEISFTVDKDMLDLTIAASVEKYSKVHLNVTDPHGTEESMKLVDTDTTKVLIIAKPKYGTYKATIDSESKGNVDVKAFVNNSNQ